MSDEINCINLIEVQSYHILSLSYYYFIQICTIRHTTFDSRFITLSPCTYVDCEHTFSKLRITNDTCGFGDEPAFHN